MEAFDVILSGTVQVGTRDNFRTVSGEERHVVVAATRADAEVLAVRVLGEFTGQPSLRNGTVDRISEWFHRFSLEGNGSKQSALDVLRWLPRRLGSITLTGYVLSFSGEDELQAFWIEIEEGDRRRVLASELRNEAFVGFGEDFEFSAVDLALAAVDMF